MLTHQVSELRVSFSTQAAGHERQSVEQFREMAQLVLDVGDVLDDVLEWLLASDRREPKALIGLTVPGAPLAIPNGDPGMVKERRMLG